jgi:hypothetical protein
MPAWPITQRDRRAKTGSPALDRAVARGGHEQGGGERQTSRDVERRGEAAHMGVDEILEDGLYRSIALCLRGRAREPDPGLEDELLDRLGLLGRGVDAPAREAIEQVVAVDATTPSAVPLLTLERHSRRSRSRSASSGPRRSPGAPGRRSSTTSSEPWRPASSPLRRPPPRRERCGAGQTGLPHTAAEDHECRQRQDVRRQEPLGLVDRAADVVHGARSGQWNGRLVHEDHAGRDGHRRQGDPHGARHPRLGGTPPRSGHPTNGPPGAWSRWPVLSRRAQRSEFATSSRRSMASCMPASIPELMWPSRSSWFECCTRISSVVRPSSSVSMRVLSASASGKPS